MADVEELCNRVAIINRGRILYEGSVSDLKGSLGGMTYRLRTSDPAGAQRVAAGLDLDGLSADDGELRFSADEGAVERLTIALGRAGIGVHALVPQQASLEELFFQLTEPDGGHPVPEPPRLEAVG
jgi:ABC-2 type transport system ATP-binding protein